MGKPARPKKKENSDTVKEKSEPERVVKDDNNVIDTLEERLRRMEIAQSQSSSDVYKFAFFFFMGIVLTVIVYPGVSNTINSLKQNNEQIKVVHREADIQIPDDIGDKEQTGNVELTSKTFQTSPDKNSTKSTVNKLKTEDLMIDEKDEDTTIDIVDDTYVEINEPDDLPETQKHDDFTEKRASEPLKLTPVNPESDTLRVELSPEHVQLSPEESKKEANHDQLKKKTADKDKTAKTKTPAKQAKSKKDKTKVKMSSKKSDGKKDTNSDVKDTSANQNDIPKEVKDFKPTYQKTTVPKKIFADGRRIPPMELLPQKPNNSSVKVWLFDDFLSEQECDGLMRVHNQHTKDQSKDDPILCFDTIATLRKHLKNVGKTIQVTPRDFTEGTTCVNKTFSSQLKEWFNGNWSYSTAFYPGESRFANIFENRIEQAMGLKPVNGGKFQITSYPLGIGYKSHTDCMEDSSDQRDRMATVLVYLDTVSEGGETDFPELGIWVRPRKGRALMWNNMDTSGKCEPLSIHQAKKVVTGHKYIIQRWYYYKSFYSLGKRPPEPPLPVRSPGQPRVSCDEYEYGSCRWYDEWNFEHLIEYEKQKYTLV